MKIGDRVLYVGRNEKYRSTGTVTKLKTGVSPRNRGIPSFWVEFDNGERGLFSHASDFVPAPAVDELAQLAKGIRPTHEDIGRGVVYTPYPGAKAEDGVITSFNGDYVFVRYSGDQHSKATRREDLQWLTRTA